MKRSIALLLATTLLMCIFSACSLNPEKKILGKWYNENGDCLEILSDHTYSVDNIPNGYELGINKGTWEYLGEEGYFKFYPRTYDSRVIKVEIDRDSDGTYIEYAYYGTFYKD